ncbi:hypothetical protein HMPREF9554_02339 [Treponema phagedenis F0421]|nr:hypothetical protein HMPREF9554_02339 [Treponema phagedenis F0421]
MYANRFMATNKKSAAAGKFTLTLSIRLPRCNAAITKIQKQICKAPFAKIFSLFYYLRRSLS